VAASRAEDGAMADHRVYVADQNALRAWLSEHHGDDRGVWIVYDKGRGRSLRYADIVDEAVCFGWIDSQPRSLSDEQAMLWLAPRRPTQPPTSPARNRSPTRQLYVLRDGSLDLLRRDTLVTLMTAGELLGYPSLLTGTAIAAEVPALEWPGDVRLAVRLGINTGETYLHIDIDPGFGETLSTLRDNPRRPLSKEVK
jgi:hypothetical protein